jgi:uncharacterized membrane protein (DUF106 family)
MQKDIFEKIINFLLGASWAFVIVGALLTFKVFFSFGFGFSLFLTIMFVIISLLVVVLLEALLINKERLKEAKKQTQLLEKIYQEKETQIIST